jgi:multidrug efflux pump subunit AcrA (membrane-fusion protein)
MSVSASLLRRRIIPLILIVLAILLFAALFPSWSSEGGGEEQEEGQAVSPADMNVRVRTATVETGEMPVTIKAVGVFVPRMQSPAMVVSLIPGIVSQVDVREGQMVEAGAVMIRLDPRRSQGALAKAKAGLRVVESSLQKAVHGGLDTEQVELDLAAQQAKVAVQQARLEADRQKALLADHLASGKAAFDAQVALEEAERRAKAAEDKATIFRTVGREMELAQLDASVEQSKAELAAAQLDREVVDIRAPQAGRVSGLKVNVGSAVDDKTVLAQVIDERTAVLRFWLAPSDMQGIRPGATVTVQPGSSKESLTGRVISVGAELDSETGLVPVEAQLEPGQSGPPRMGETVLGEITTQSNVKGMIIPVSSIVVEDDKASVFTVDDKQIAHAVPIQVLARTQDRAVILAEGLAAGARVIADGNYNLPDGAHVVEEPSK